MISTLQDAAIFFIKWKQDETVLDLFVAMQDCVIESCAVIRYFRGEWLELATNSDATLIRIYLPNIVRYELVTPAEIPVITLQRRPALRTIHSWMLSHADGVVYLISELDEPRAQIGGEFQS